MRSWLRTKRIYWAERILGLSPADIDFIVENRENKKKNWDVRHIEGGEII